jgi:NAD-dependent deacetylase
MANFPTDIARRIHDVVNLLRDARSVLFITGAGLSADSGLPTYRGIGGLYNDADAESGLPIEELLSGRQFRADPARTWKYLAEIGKAGRGKTPNRGHQVMAEMERHFDRVWVLTQNVDGFHRTAGSKNVIDIHGDLHNLRCTACDHHGPAGDYTAMDLPPKCPKCSAVLRPNVVLFGESLPMDAVATLRRELARGFDVVFSVGTTSVFPYIAGPVLDARERGRASVEINPGETEVSELVTVKLPLKAATALHAVWEAHRTS